MKNLYFLNPCTFFIFLLVMSYGQEDKKVIAKIEHSTVENQMKLKATVTNNTAIYKELNYLLVSIKKGGEG